MTDTTALKAAILATCHRKKLNLTALRETVLDIALAEKGVIKAYQVLAKMQTSTTRAIAPPSVYRSLDFWAHLGVLHKVDAVNGYIVCRHATLGGAHGDMPFVLVCRECGAVSEPDFAALAQALTTACTTQGFHNDSEAVVVTGVCAQGCQSDDTSSVQACRLIEP